MLIFWALLAVLFALLALWRLEWAVLLTIVCLPAYLLRLTIGGLPTTVLELMILIVVAVWLFKNLDAVWSRVRGRFRGQKIKNYPFVWEIVACLIISLVALGVGNWSWSALGLWRAYFLEPLLFFLVVCNIFAPKESLKKIVYALSLSAFGVSLVAWYQQFVDMKFLNPVWSEQIIPRATSVFPYANAVGLYLAPIIVVLVGWFVYEEKARLGRSWLSCLKSIWIGVVIVMSMAALIFARSEGALVGLVVALFVFGLLASWRSLALTLSIAGVLGLAIFLTPPVKSFIWEKATLQDLAGEIRQQQWRETWSMLKNNSRWLWGAGLNGYQTAVKQWHQEGIFFNFDKDANFHAQTVLSAEYRATHWQPVEVYLYPHNIILNFWSELGLAGALLFVWLIVKYLFLGLKNIFVFGSHYTDRYLTLGLLSAMVVIIVHGLVDVPYFKNDLAVLFWLLFAMMGLVNEWNKNKVS